MASWMVHLRVAQALGAPFTGTPQEATAYYVGAVGPDCGAYIAENVFDPPTQVTHWAPDGYKRNCDAPAFRAASAAAHPDQPPPMITTLYKKIPPSLYPV